MTYYAFRQFSELYGLSNECECICPDGLFACAATGNQDMLAVSNISDNPITLRIRAVNARSKEGQLYNTDSTHRYEKIGIIPLDSDAKVTLPRYSFISVKIS